jgi:hypothetical protein
MGLDQKEPKERGNQVLTPVILATQETEIRRIMVQNQPRQLVCETLSQKKKKPFTKKGWWSGSRCRPQVQTPAPQKKDGRDTRDHVDGEIPHGNLKSQD